MLDQLRELHVTILERLAELDRRTADEQPQIDRLMSVRFALTRASRARTKLLEAEVYPHLLAKLTGRQADEVRKLQAEGKAALATSSQHIGRWSLRTISSEWKEYQKASNVMRSSMRKRIKAEEALYPLMR